MVHFYVFDPLRKLRLLSALFIRRSQRGTAPPLALRRPAKTQSLSIALQTAPAPSPVRDADYYRDESEGGFCVFQVENTLFKVHQCFLAREPSAFGDMFSLPEQAQSTECAPVFLSDTVEQFRDLLWALYASPADLWFQTPVPIGRLLNIAELANKYCFASLESWAVGHIYGMAQDATGPLRGAPLDVCASVLNVAILCDHAGLCDTMARGLTARVLWHSAAPDAIIALAERHGLRTLQGVGYYRQLVDMERTPPGDPSGAATQPAFHPKMELEKRMRFLAAHHSLVRLWEGLRASPPPFRCAGCPPHARCTAAWRRIWLEAGLAEPVVRRGSADVLGRLKAMMAVLRKTTASTSSMTLQCSLLALEAVAVARDVIVDGLIDHFTID